MNALVGLGGAAMAAWLLPASVHIVEWTDEGPRRLGLFASRGLLILLLAAALAAAAFLWRRGSASGTAWGWLGLLWLWAVPFLPWLPDRFPLLLVLAGPLRWLVAAAAVGGLLWSRGASVTSPLLPPAAYDRLRELSTNPRSLRTAVFAASLAVYLTLGALHARAIGPGGDEPHYLVIAHSLLTDGDLLIENNHVERDYLPFWGGPPLRPDYMKRGLNGQIYSIHAPGLAALVLPAYAAAGYAGVVAFLCVLAALASVAIFALAREVAGLAAALWTWVAVGLTVPFLPHAWLIYPELPGALIVAWATLWVWRGSVGRTFRCAADGGPQRSALQALLRGAALGLLPWLHTKFIIFTAVFGGALAVALWRRPRALALFIVPIAASVVAWLISFYVIYGTFNPEAPYGDYPRLFVLVRNIPRGLLGLLFDQKFGLLIYAPVYLFAVAGMWLMLRQRELRWLGVVTLAAVALHVGSTTRLYMWWGGNSAPARFLLPILPCLAPSIAVAAARLESAGARALLWTATVVSVIVGIGGLLAPERLLLFSDPRGKGRIIELLQGPAPLSHLMPTFAQENWQQPLLELLPWLAAAAAALAALVYMERRGSLRSPVWAATCAGLVFSSSAALLATGVAVEGRKETARRGATDVLWQYDPGRQRPLDYQTLGRVTQADVYLLSTLWFDPYPASAEPVNQRIIAGPFNLPPGSYEARVWFAPNAAAGGDIVVSASDRAVFARQSRARQGPLSVPFQLPVAVRRLTIGASEPAATAALRVAIEPLAVVPPGARETAAIRSLESIPDHPGAYVAYTNEHAYPEGGIFWTRGTGRASVLVAAPGARRVTLTLFSGPAAAECTVSLAGTTQTVKMTPGETSTVSFEVPANRTVLPLDVQSSAFFRPSDANPASTDNRGLGCQVRIGLE